MLKTTIDILGSDVVEFEKYYKNSFQTNNNLLNFVLNYVVKTKGKGLRPFLVLLWNKLFSTCHQKTYRTAALVELLHSATLIHDDVVDEADFRRGFFSIKALWKNKIAVLAGDFLLSRGMLLALEHKDYDMLELLSKAVKNMSEGELLQLETARIGKMDETIYYTVVKQKTASLFAVSCAAGALCASADKPWVDLAFQYGETIGLAFQIKDDLIDFENYNSGKLALNDLKEKKFSLPVIYTYQQLKGYEKEEFNYLAKNSHKKKYALKLKDVISAKKGFDFAQDKLNQLKHDALNLLSECHDSVFKNELIQITNYIIDRKK